MTERAGPDDESGLGHGDKPATLVFGTMIVSAGQMQVALIAGPPIHPVDDVILVGLGRGHATARPGAHPAADLDVSS
jgi:hypothetical protein